MIFWRCGRAILSSTKKSPASVRARSGAVHQESKRIMTDPDQDRNISNLIDKRRALSAQLAGVELQIAMFVGDRDAARQHLKEMNAQTEARYAARFAAQNGRGAH